MNDTTFPSGRLGSRWLRFGLRGTTDALIVLVPTAAGAGLVWWHFRRLGGVRLMGGLVPGLWVAAAVGLLGVFLIARYCRVPRPTSRKRGYGGFGWRAVGRGLAGVRFALLGALLGAALLRSFHPVRANTVHVVVELADPLNDKQFQNELLDTAVQLLRENPGRDVQFAGTDRLGELVRLAADGKLNRDDPRWWDELRRQPKVADRLAALESALADYVGETVCVVSVSKPTGRVSPWPLSPERLVCRWYCVDPSQVPRADRTQLVSYSLNQDPAVAPKFYATLSVKPGEPTPRLRTQMVGEPPKLHDATGRFGDYFGYEAAIPRDKAVAGIDFEKPDGTAVPIAALKDLKVAPRRLRVELGPGLDRLKALPLVKEADGPVEFVDSNPDVSWVVGKSARPASGGPVVEIAFSPQDYTTAPQGYQLRRTNGYMKSALGQVGLPSAGAEFRDLSGGLGLKGQVLVGLGRDAGDDPPVVLHRDVDDLRWVTVVLPRPDQFDLMTDNVSRAMAQLLIWATSHARREGRPDPPPVLTKLLVDRASEVELPTRSGPNTIRDGLVTQLLAGLRGRLDGNRHLSAANSLRSDCGVIAAAAAAVLIALTLIAAGVERRATSKPTAR